MKPAQARQILEAWARGTARPLPNDILTDFYPPCTLSSDQIARLYRVLKQANDHRSAAPNLIPLWLPPP